MRNLMSQVNQANLFNKPSTGTKIPVGTHNNIKLTDIKLVPGEGTDTYIEYHFEDEDGAVHHNRIYDFNPEYSKARSYQDKAGNTVNVTKEEQEIKDLESLLKKIASPAYALLDPEEVEAGMNMTGVPAYMNSIKNMLMPKIGEMVSIKLLPTKDLKYSQFPYFGDWIYANGNANSFYHSKYEKNLLEEYNDSAPTSDEAVVPGPSILPGSAS